MRSRSVSIHVSSFVSGVDMNNMTFSMAAFVSEVSAINNGAVNRLNTAHWPKPHPSPLMPSQPAMQRGNPRGKIHAI
jgi:hypothetical protein